MVSGRTHPDTITLKSHTDDNSFECSIFKDIWASRSTYRSIVERLNGNSIMFMIAKPDPSKAVFLTVAHRSMQMALRRGYSLTLTKLSWWMLGPKAIMLKSKRSSMPNPKRNNTMQKSSKEVNLKTEQLKWKLFKDQFARSYNSEKKNL